MTEHTARRRSLAPLEKQYRELTADLAEIGYVLQGSLTTRWMRCGKAACRCAEDPDARHGPYHLWTYKRAGRSVCVYVCDEQTSLCAQWIENNRRLERIVRKMRAISGHMAELREIPKKQRA